MNYETWDFEGDIGQRLDLDQGTTASYSKHKQLDPFELESYLNNAYATSGTTGIGTPYFRSNNLDILSQASNIISRITNDEIREMVIELLLVFQEYLNEYRLSQSALGHLPPLTIRIVEDGSILIEWIFKDFRIGFSIEPDIAQSSWYLVSNANLEEVSESGILNFKEIEKIIKGIISFVIDNS